MEVQPVASGSTAVGNKRAAAAGVKRKLACQACRMRRIKCEWPEDGTANCDSCTKSDLKCPGEPEPRKRAKRTDESREVAIKIATPAADSMSQLAMSGAVVFHMIESLFVMANPAIAGAPYNFFRDLLNGAGGSSRELEIAAEVLCSCFIASASTFTDHSLLVGPGDLEMPTECPSGITTSYAHYTSYGAKRAKNVATLAARALATWDENTMEDRPGTEAIFTALCVDQMQTLTSLGRRKERGFVDKAIKIYKALLDKASQLTQEQLTTLRGPLALHLLRLDAETAAIARTPCAFNQLDLSIYFPSLDSTVIPSAVVRSEPLIPDEDGWTELGKQLAPVALQLAFLSRTFAYGVEPSRMYQIWNAVDQILTELDLADDAIHQTPPLETQELTDHRQFDLFGLTSTYRRKALQLDLLAHEAILDRFVSAGDNPPPFLLDGYATSRIRIHQAFKHFARIAFKATFHRSLLMAHRLLETMEISSSWTDLRTAEPAQAAILLGELGIDVATGATLAQALELASWSSALAEEQLKALKAGLSSNPTLESLESRSVPELLEMLESNSVVSSAQASTNAYFGTSTATAAASSLFPTQTLPHPTIPMAPAFTASQSSQFSEEFLASLGLTNSVLPQAGASTQLNQINEPLQQSTSFDPNLSFLSATVPAPQSNALQDFDMSFGATADGMADSMDFGSNLFGGFDGNNGFEESSQMQQQQQGSSLVPVPPQQLEWWQLQTQ